MTYKDMHWHEVFQATARNLQIIYHVAGMLLLSQVQQQLGRAAICSEGELSSSADLATIPNSLRGVTLAEMFSGKEIS